MPTQPYHTSDGKRVPSVSTIKGVYDGGKSEGLMRWARDLALDGNLDALVVRDEAADIGTLAHAICTGFFTGEQPDMTGFTPEQQEAANSSALSFFTWLGDHTFEPLLVEQPLVSEVHRFGGTPDLYGLLDGAPTLVDLKTSKSIFLRGRLKADYALQMGGYTTLLREHGHEVAAVTVLGIPKTDDTPMEVYDLADIEACVNGFLWCLDGYRMAKGWK